MSHALFRSTTLSGFASGLLLVFALAAASCAIDPQGGASLRFRVSGAFVPKQVQAPSDATSRALVGGTASVRVSVQGDEVNREETIQLAPGSNEASLAGLPVQRPLRVTVAALGRSGQVLTSWEGETVLAEGDNTLAATLRPNPSTVLPLTAVDGQLNNIDTANLNPGAVRFYQLSFPASLAGQEIQIVANTNKAQWLWLGLYDENWAPAADVIALDQGQGWAVAPATSGKVWHLAIANAVDSPGYPSGVVGYTLQARQCYFVASTGSGSGSSQDPASFSALYSGLAGLDGKSIFLSAAHYQTSFGPLNPTSGNLWFYGGFDPSDWRYRNPEQRASVVMGPLATPGPAVYVSGSAETRFDGLRIEAHDFTNSQSSVTGLLYQSSGQLIVSNSELSGNTSTAALGTANYLSNAVSIVDGAGLSEFANCLIDAGVVNQSGIFTASTLALDLQGNTSSYIHNCVINGGYALQTNATSISQTGGVKIAFHLNAIIAGCTIFGSVALQTQGANLDAGSIGVQVAADAGPGNILANSNVSGGICSSNNSFSKSYALNVTSSSGSGLLAVGNTLDAGLVANPNTSQHGAVYYNASAAPATRLVGNAIMNSSLGYYANNCLLVRSSSDFSGIWDNALFGPANQQYALSLIAPPYPINDPTNGSPNAARNTSLTNGIASYLMAYDTSWSAAATAFAEWQAKNDWRPRGSLGASYDPVTLGVLSNAQIQSYPALGLDRSGSPRPSGSWQRGAWQ